MFKTKKIDENEIYNEILNQLPHDFLFDYLKHNKALMTRFKGFRLNKKNCAKETIIKSIIDLMPQNGLIRKFVFDIWDKSIEPVKDVAERLETEADVIKYRESDDYTGDLLALSTILMTNENENMNAIGEALFEEYANMRCQGDESEELYWESGENDMDKNEKTIMDLTISDCLALIEQQRQKLTTANGKNEKDAEELRKVHKKLDEVILELSKYGKMQNTFSTAIKQSFDKLSGLENTIGNMIKKEKEISSQIETLGKAQKNLLSQVNEVVQEVVKHNNSVMEDMIKKNMTFFFSEKMQSYADAIVLQIMEGFRNKTDSNTDCANDETSAEKSNEPVQPEEGSGEHEENKQQSRPQNARSRGNRLYGPDDEEALEMLNRLDEVIGKK